MRLNMAGLLSAISLQIIPEDESLPEGDSSNLLELIEDARLDWDVAKSYFDNVSEPDLIDHAIYTVEAAQRRYTYLLKKAKELGIATNTLSVKPFQSI